MLTRHTSLPQDKFDVEIHAYLLTFKSLFGEMLTNKKYKVLGSKIKKNDELYFLLVELKLNP